ncbi:carnitine metabolism transcriptional regulator CaiF [Providencia rettgeri]|uniref:carnitine metabolism transcriptional regulator CaiF n=1 Tax=Providencia rettgeri TaxID=587 RepID=UPI0034E09EE0
MCGKYTNEPLYLSIAHWVMKQGRWTTAREISNNFDIPHPNAVNIVSYILSDVAEIQCEVKMIPNKLSGRGCQCQRLIKVNKIDNQLYARLRNHQSEKVTLDAPVKATSMPPSELNREQKWQWMLSKAQRR